MKEEHNGQQANDPCVKFCPSFPQRFSKNKHFNECFQKYHSCFWLESARNWDKFENVFVNVVSMQVEYFVFIRTLISSLKVIEKVEFSNLKILCLEDNKIESIEAICLLNIPKIKEISLRNNKIVSIRPLVKICQNKEAKLSKLSLDGNKIQEVSDLYKCNVSLEGLFLDVATYDTPCGIDLKVLAKCETLGNFSLLINSIWRIKQNEVIRVLNKKSNA